MAGELREWADIDRTWLQNYLREHNLGSEFDLDDELIGSQVSWILNEEEWTKLRDAWQKQQHTEQVRDAAAQVPVAEEIPAATEASLESAESAEEPGAATAEPDKQSDEERRLYELTQKALSDWGAFNELFRNCPDSAGLASWETLADSPVALLEQAEKLILMERARTEGQKKQQEEDFEEDVNRAQNIIAGYYLYCRKSRITPSLEHMLVHIPMMRTGHSPEVVKEAWRRQAEHSK